MLENIKSDEILFLDIETVPQSPVFENLDNAFKHLWDKKSSHFRKSEESAADVYARAGIYAEFGKIICISTGYLHINNGEQYFRVKSFFDDNESKLLQDFNDMLTTFSSKKNIQLCAHNGKEFDFPYIARRILVNGLQLPKLLDIAGKKPWEVNFIDTLELWKFGDYKSFTSLELLTKIFGIPTPKDDIDGSMVADVYWKEKNLTRIVTYCEKDVLAVAQLLLKYKGEPLIKEKNYKSITFPG
ncbi:MAG TPA: 3'-5' exonuclease [Bacteroidales bacterium]